MEMWTILAVLVLIALLAPRYGVDSRWPGQGQLPPVPDRPSRCVENVDSRER